ncbi:MAG TPA: hypothetical protein VG247_22410 [Pseudonocardiaceae bacterium]|nr:hypothetical protein [Pseudonocardiaceae bacterium]
MRRYAELFRTPGTRQAEFFAVIGRFGYIACGLGVLFLGTARLGIGTGGLGAGGLTLGVAVGSPVAGRLSSRYGVSPLYAVLAGASTVGTTLALLGAENGAGAVFLVGSCLTGATIPPFGAAMRALWPKSGLPEELRAAANSLESVVTELIFVFAPPVTGVLAALEPGLGLIAADGCVLLGGIGFSCTGLVRRSLGPRRDTASRSVARHRVSVPVVWLVCVGGVTAAVTGAMDVAVVSVLNAAGEAKVAGFVLLVPALASVVTGTVYGLLPAERAPGRRFGLLLLVWLPPFALVALASSPWLLAGALFLAGVPMAAIGVEEFTLLSRAAGDANLHEVFTWAGAVANVGVAAGNSLSGFMAQHLGSSASAWLPAAAVALACALYFTGSRLSRGSLIILSQGGK